MLLQFTLVVLGFLIAALISAVRGRSETYRIIRQSVLEGILGGLLISLVMLQFHLSDLLQMRNQIVEANLLEALDETIRTSPRDAPMLDSIRDRKVDIEEELNSILKGRLVLRDEEEVYREATRHLDECATVVLQVNRLEPAFISSQRVSLERELRRRRRVTDRGVSIKEIVIHDPQTSVSDAEAFKLIQSLQNTGTEVRITGPNAVNRLPGYTKYSQLLGGTLDFTMFDFGTLLLRFRGPDGKVRTGILTRERGVVDAAKELFDLMWDGADGSLGGIVTDS